MVQGRRDGRGGCDCGQVRRVDEVLSSFVCIKNCNLLFWTTFMYIKTVGKVSELELGIGPVARPGGMGLVLKGVLQVWEAYCMSCIASRYIYHGWDLFHF